MRRPWFKHFTNSSQGATIRALLDAREYESVVLFWLLLEMMGRFESQDSPGHMMVHVNTICKEMNQTSKKVFQNLSKIISKSFIRFESDSEGLLKFYIPKWLELQTSWGGKREARFEQDAGRSKKREVRGKKREKSPSADALPHLALLWNKHRGNLPQVMGCTGKRFAAARARWDEKPDTEYWAELIDRLNRSSFCSGKNEKGWKADFDFLIRPDTQYKILEGKYEDHKAMSEINTTPLRLEDIV